MSILYYCAGDTEQRIFNAIKSRLPAATIEQWPSCKNPAEVTTAMVWKPPADFFDGLVSLKNVLSIAAGVDHLLTHRGLPENIQLVRLADAGMADTMCEYVLFGVLHAHRQMSVYQLAQQQAKWTHDATAYLPPAKQFKVGILGAGQLGSKVAERLKLNGYDVSCWGRSPRTLDGIKHYAGSDALTDMLAVSNVIVCLLPLTEDTRGLLNATTFAQAPRGAFIINAGRGGHLVEEDLLQAIDSGQLSGALLDVFETEPLPQHNPLWLHPKVLITPHIAAPTPVDGAAEQLAESVRLLDQGLSPIGLVDRSLGY